MDLNKKNVKTILLIITFAVVVSSVVQHLGVFYGAIQSIWRVLSTVVAGLGIAFVLNVPLRSLENGLLRPWRNGNNPAARKAVRPVAMLLTLLIIFGIVALLLGVVIPQLSQTIGELADKLPKYFAVAMTWIEGVLESLNFDAEGLNKLTVDWQAAITKLVDLLKDGAGGIIGTAGTLGYNVVNGAISFVFSLIIAIYVLAKKESVGAFTRRVFCDFVPERINREVFRIASMTNEVFGNFISGQLIDSTILGILCYIGMRIFRFEYPEVIAVTIAVTSLVPMVGSFIGEVVGMFLLLFVSPLKALLFLLFILCLQQIDNTFIYPRIVGKSVGLPGVVVLCAVIVGGKVFGVLGTLLSVPACAVLYSLLLEIMTGVERKKTTAH